MAGTKSEPGSSAPPVAISAFVTQPLAAELLTLLGSGSLAGLAFGVSDLVRVSLAIRGWVGVPVAAAVLGLWLWFGQLLALFVWLARGCAVALRRWVPNRAAWHALLALFAGSVALLLARKLFGGGGIRRTYVGSAGPWVLPSCVVLGAWLAARLLAGRWARVTRWKIVGAAAALSLAAGVLDTFAAGDYLYLHVLLLTLGLALASHAVELTRLPAVARRAALAASLLTLPSLLAFPASRPARELLARPTWAGLQLVDYAQFRFDFDHDGRSPLFGGGDCNDWDAAVYVGAPERAGDGRDSDCDGFDDPKPSTLVFEPFHTHGEPAAQRISARAKQFPTVVILVDALRFDRVGDPRFPSLAQLARESIRFSQAYATSATTLSSVPAIMRGRVRPAPQRETIAQALTRADQASVFIAPDVVLQHFQKLGLSDPLRGFSSREVIPTDHETGWGMGDTVATSERVTAAAIARLDSAQPPALLWLYYFDVHQWDALAEQGLPSHGDVTRYDAVLERLDAALRPLLDRRDRMNIVLLADHGEGLGARGIVHHTNYVFEQLAHIPLLVRVPGSKPAAVAVPVNSTGVFNMLRALRGLEPSANADANLLALVGATDVGAGPGFPSFENAQWSLLYGSHRLLYMPKQQLVELYDLEQDPLEQRNQAEADPQLASDLLARLFQLHNEPPQ